MATRPREVGPGGRRPPSRPRLPVVAVIVLVAAAGLLASRGLSPVPSGPPSVQGSPSPSAPGSPDASVATQTAATGTPATPSASAVPSAPPSADRGYLTSVAELRDQVARARVGQQPQADALADLLAFAADAKTTPANPQATIDVTGTEGPILTDGAAAYGLALAWAGTGDTAAGEHAREIVNAWVTTARATSGTCATGGECQTSLVISRAAPAFVFAVDLLSTDRSLWSQADDSAFRDWLRTIILPAASDRPNNWGDAGTMLRFVASDYLGDAQGVAKAVDLWRGRLDLITSEGEIPEETRRGTAGMQYTQEALMYKTVVAFIAARRGLDLWDATGKLGGSLKKATDLLADYWVHPEDWPWNPNVARPDPAPFWELAYDRWRDPAYASIVVSGRPYGADGHSAIRWTTLTNGITVGG